MTTAEGSAVSRGAGSAPPGRELTAAGAVASGHVLRTLSPDECFDLLEPGGVGRVGFAAADGIMMLPVNFAVARKTIIFRTAPDTLLAVYAGGPVGFEVDRLDEARREGWSVLMRGHARTVTDERDVKHLENTTLLESWAAGSRDVYVRITPTRITGRRIEPL